LDPPSGGDLDLSGQQLGDFQVLRKLGSGGMGQVYLAEQISLKRPVALKVLRRDLAADRTALERFRREAETVARVHHANIVQVYAVGDHEGTPYIALEYVEGRNLREFVARKGSPEVLLAMSIMRQVAAALQRASEHGIVHRDIKPENILLTRKGEAKLTDFGLLFPLSGEQLRLTQSGVTMGTPLYMSPEQVQGQPTDPRADIYSFGATCYYMLAGEPPFQGTNPYDVALKHVTATPAPLQSVRPDLPPELCAIVHKMMAKDPAQRYQTGRELLKDLHRLRERIGSGQATQMVPLDSVPGLVPPPAAVNGPQARPVSTMDAVPVRPPRPLWPWLLAVSVLLAFGLSSGLAWGLRWAEAPPTPQSPLPGDLAAVEPPETLDRREQRLKANADQNSAPKGDKQIRLGLGQYAELGLFYLDQWRLDDADQVFAKLETAGTEVRSYGVLGRLGRGVVSGLRNRPTDSYQMFRAALKDTRLPKEGFDLWDFLNQNPHLRQWISLAIDYNQSNAPGQTPLTKEQLEALYHERPPRLPPTP
jgi:serine/threonine-protein kinase